MLRWSRNKRFAVLVTLSSFLLFGFEMDKTPAFIGTAEMMADRSIVLKLRGQSEDGAIGDGLVVYAVESPGYGELLEHLGGLEPLQSKMVPPWPEEPGD